MEFHSGHQKINIGRIFSSSASLFVCYLILGTQTIVHGWTYNYSSDTMMWVKARRWCQTHYTDIAAIQTREQNDYLREYLPPQNKHYWIGLRKIKDVWTWVGINKSLAPEAANWAEGEPNNGKRNEVCAEFYVKRENDTGKWNDESCLRKKTPLCYKASCLPNSCSDNGECVEMINNHKCECFSGFYGMRCENAVVCEKVDHPSHSFINCSHPFGKDSYLSLCQFSCEDGYQLVGSRTIQCTASRNWSATPPRCEADQCRELVSPAHGSTRCAHPLGSFRYTTACEFRCEEGYRLTTSSKLLCGPGGQWTADQPRCKEFCQPDSCSGNGECVEMKNGLKCECFPGFNGHRCESAVVCEKVDHPSHGFINCSHPFGNNSYLSLCQFSCEDGYQLVGSRTIQCTASRKWSATPPRCEVVSCSIVLAPQNGSATCRGTPGEFRHSFTCHFTCHAGFTLHGSEVMTCDASGKWVGVKPLCRAHPDPVQSPALVAAATGAGALSLLTVIGWVLKQLHKRRKVKQFDLNSDTNSNITPDIYRSSTDKLI